MANNTNIPHLPPPSPTGGMLVTMKPGQSSSDAIKKLKKVTGMDVKSLSNSVDDDAVRSMASQSGDVVYFENLGIAVISPEDTNSLSTLTTSLSAEDSVASVQPEFHLFAIESVEQR